MSHLKIGIALLGLLGSVVVGKGPNIVFLMTDDQRWDSMGCYGRPEFETPNIDRLANQGVIFDKAFHTVSICMPSRVTMMTGRYLSSHRVGFTAPYNDTLSRADFTKSYPAQLKQAGYRTGFIGKLGFSVTEKTEFSTYTKRKGYEIKDHVGDVFDFYADEFGTHTFGEAAIWPEDDEGLRAIFSEEGRKQASRTYRTGKAMLRFLETQPKDQPFCLSVSFYAVKHGHFHKPDVDRFRKREFSVPGNWVEGANKKLPEVVAKHARGYRLHVERTSKPAQYQDLVRKFAAQGYSVDQQVGLLVDKLKELGVLENTIIIYTSDNGRYHGSHGLYDKALLHEESVRQPLIVFDGRMPESKRGRREPALVSSVNLAPTMLSLAGLTPPRSMQGLDLSKVLTATQDMSEWRDAVFFENRFINSMVGPSRQTKGKAAEANAKLIKENKSYRSEGARNERFKYFVYHEHQPPIEELYDLKYDPLEQDNLAGNPEFAEVLKKMRDETKAVFDD